MFCFASVNSINLSKIEREIVEKHSFFEELSEKVQSLKNIYALELSTTKKMLKELKNDYGSISTSSKKIKENEILITSFIESLTPSSMMYSKVILFFLSELL